VITELLGPEGFGIISKDTIRNINDVLSRRTPHDNERVRDFFAISSAELALWTSSQFHNLHLPLVITPELLSTVEYKCNTFALGTCGTHITDEDKRAEYAFLFVSDYWKIMRIFQGKDVLELLVSNPTAIRAAMAERKWDFSKNDKAAAARDLTVMLWSAKAHILVGTDQSEFTHKLTNYVLAADLGNKIPGLRVSRPAELA
jgi:hypothetical protein